MTAMTPGQGAAEAQGSRKSAIDWTGGSESARISRGISLGITRAFQEGVAEGVRRARPGTQPLHAAETAPEPATVRQEAEVIAVRATALIAERDRLREQLTARDAELAAERERADKAEAKAAACEGGIDWVTSCLSCSAVLDSCIAETNRREGAEGKLAEAVLMLGEIREYAHAWIAVAMRLSTPETRAEADCGRKILGLIDADAPTDDDENDRPPRPTASEGTGP